MGRIRTIKPEFPQSESVGRISREARLLFIQLWTLCDDAGRARAASRMLASLLYPFDDDAPTLIEGWLSELDASGLIRRYVVDATTYLEICKWLEHQKIDRPTKSRLPEFREGSRVIVEASTTDLGPRTLDLKNSRAVGKTPRAPRADCDAVEAFWQRFRKAYPKRKGSLNWPKAREKFISLVNKGADPEKLISGASRYADECKADDSFGTKFVCMVTTFLNQIRWQDGDEPSSAAGIDFVALRAGSEQWDAWWAHFESKSNGKPDFGLSQMRRAKENGGAYTAVAEWPPGHEKAKAKNGHADAFL